MKKNKKVQTSLPPYYPWPRQDVEQAILEEELAIKNWFDGVFGESAQKRIGNFYGPH